jgi:Glu-tRNA(Gln) amidotransferase subunit E-like FAD-binding protein
MPGEVAVAKEIKEPTIGGFRKWEVEGWLRSLQEADDIRTDKKKLKAVQMLAGEQMAAIRSIADIKVAREKLNKKS